MPATRRRTEHWRQSLEQIKERNGSLEIALARSLDGGGGDPSVDQVSKHLIWRVRLLDLDDERIIVERPSTLGQTIDLRDGMALIGVIVVGQNRWMFHTEKLADRVIRLNSDRSIPGVALRMPTRVERCQRRSFYRISTVGLELPEVECWPIINPSTIEAAEHAVRTRLVMVEDRQIVGSVGVDEETLLRPEVGPSLHAKLVNLGGGGAGLMIEPEQAHAIGDRKMFWLAIDLRPQIPTPFGVAARLVHTHRDSQQRLYAGFSFEFAAGGSHKQFIIDLICRYVTELQREQLRRLSG